MDEGKGIMGDEEISLRDIFLALKRRKRIILYCTVVTTVLGLLYAVLATPLYTATVTVQPATDQGGGLSDLASQFSGAAALAGISLGGGDTNRTEYIAILQSRALAYEFMQKDRVVPYLFPDQWDSATGKWRTEEQNGVTALLSKIRQAISSFLTMLSGDEGSGMSTGQGGQAGPTMWDAYKVLSQNVRLINEDIETGLVTVSFEFRNPVLAAKWANDYVAIANQEIRQRTIEEASRALDYLNDKVKDTTVAGLRDTIFRLVESQLEIITLANTREEYAFRIIDKAVVPEERSFPSRSLLVILSLIVGLVTGAIAALIVDSYHRSKITQ